MVWYSVWHAAAVRFSGCLCCLVMLVLFCWCRWYWCWCWCWCREHNYGIVDHNYGIVLIVPLIVSFRGFLYRRRRTAREMSTVSRKCLRYFFASLELMACFCFAICTAVELCWLVRIFCDIRAEWRQWRTAGVKNGTVPSTVVRVVVFFTLALVLAWPRY